MSRSTSVRRIRDHGSVLRSSTPLLQDACNDSTMVAFRQPYVDIPSNNIAHLSERTSVVGGHFDPFVLLNKIVVDFPTDKVNIPDINQSEMKSQLLELAVTLRRSADVIENNVKHAKVTDSFDVFMPTPETLASEMRRHIFNVFHTAGCALGRIGPSAVVEDTRDLVRRLVSAGRVEMYKPDPGRSKVKTNDPESWIRENLSKYLDMDMVTPGSDGVVPAFNTAVYQNSGSLPKLKRFYESLTYWRRIRTRSSGSSAALVAARDYEKARRVA